MSPSTSALIEAIGNGCGIAGTVCIAIPAWKAARMLKLAHLADTGRQEAITAGTKLEALFEAASESLRSTKDAWNANDAILLFTGLALAILSDALPLIVHATHVY